MGATSSGSMRIASAVRRTASDWLSTPWPRTKHTVRIDAVGRAGDEGAEVLPLFNAERLHLAGQDDENAVDLIGQHLVERADDEEIAL